MEWTNEQIAQLTQLWADGISGQQIAIAMGISKNSVLGKVHRLDLPGRASPLIGGKTNPDFVRKNKQHIERIARARTGPALPIPSMEGPRPIHVLPAYSAQVIAPFAGIKLCQYPSGTPGTKGFRFCEAPSVPAKSYCEDHYRRCYVTWRPRQEESVA